MAQAFCHTIDVINEWLGNIFSWLIIPLVLMVVTEVTLRYVFHRPTIFAWDVNVQLQGFIVVLGGGYVLLHNGHVSMDILVSRFSPRRRALIDVIMTLFLIGSVSLLLWRVTLGAWNSVLIREELTSAWGPPIYPLKIAMVIGISALVLQGIANFIRDLLAVTRPESVSRQQRERRPEDEES